MPAAFSFLKDLHVQRILQPGEIEALDRIDFPRIRLPQPAALFAERAARWRQLAADGHPIADYLRFVALLADAQALAAREVETAPVDPALLARAVTYAMPVLPAADHLDPAWLTALDEMLSVLANAPPSAGLPPALALLAQELQDTAPDMLEAFALQVLHGMQEGTPPDTLLARTAQPLLVAALQVAYADRASRLDARALPMVEPATVCPHCGLPPVASVLRIGGEAGGHRYLHCGLCATEWHLVRVKCSNCESTKGIRYQSVEDAGEVVVAETCEHCYSYRKLVNQEKDPYAEPLADDLASLTLDLLMGETDYARASANPLLALAAEADE